MKFTLFNKSNSMCRETWSRKKKKGIKEKKKERMKGKKERKKNENTNYQTKLEAVDELRAWTWEG